MKRSNRSRPAHKVKGRFGDLYAGARAAYFRKRAKKEQRV